MKVLQNLDLNGNELKNVVVDNLSSAPTPPIAGQIYYDTTGSKLKYYDGSAWIEVGGVSIPSTTSVLKGNGNGGVAAAVAGTDYQAPLTAGTDYLAATNPTGTGSFSLNRKANTTIGTNSVAEGTDTTASANNSHAEGYTTTASGSYSHAEGSNTTASKPASHAEGVLTTASEYYAHAEGYNTTASGMASHAEGYNATASGGYSHVEGYNTTASGAYQHVQGQYNVVDQSGPSAVYADIIGNGTSSARKNIEATTFTGDKRMKGDVYVGCNDDSTGGTKLAKITDIPTTLASLTDDATHRVVTDTEKGTWDGKQNALTFKDNTTSQVCSGTNIPTCNTVFYNSSAFMNRNNTVTGANTNYTEYMARGEALYTSDTTPLQNGQISWTYA